MNFTITYLPKPYQKNFTFWLIRNWFMRSASFLKLSLFLRLFSFSRSSSFRGCPLSSFLELPSFLCSFSCLRSSSKIVKGLFILYTKFIIQWRPLKRVRHSPLFIESVSRGGRQSKKHWNIKVLQITPCWTYYISPFCAARKFKLDPQFTAWRRNDWVIWINLMKRIIESYWVKILSQILYQLKNKATNICYLKRNISRK